MWERCPCARSKQWLVVSPHIATPKSNRDKKPYHKEIKRLKQMSEHPQERLKVGLSQIHVNAFC